MLWEHDTVTLWWESSVLLEHQLLWRPSTDVHALISYIGDEGKLIALAWQMSQWPAIRDMLKPEDCLSTARVIKSTQKVWSLRSENDYFAYVKHKLATLGAA